jgi:hypothetical protein
MHGLGVRDRFNDRPPMISHDAPPLSHVVSLSPSFFSPRATILNALSDSGRCSASASFGAAVSQASTSSCVVRMTGIALGWIGATIAFGIVVRKALYRFG